MKTIEIEIGGTGHEITRSKFTKEELDKVKEYCKENFGGKKLAEHNFCWKQQKNI